MERKFSTTYIDRCGECQGRGFIIIQGNHLGHGRYADDKIQTCATCKGSGLVEITKETTVTINNYSPFNTNKNDQH